MCGICGKIYFDDSRRVSQYEIETMADSMIHRGPDDEGLFIHNNVGLGFRRLSIIDLNTGHQPISNEDETIQIVFNGEIYNFLELRKQLQSLGHSFKTNTDTEVIVHLYEQYGADCLRYLRGMFAFSIWDEKEQKLFCARDRFGIKPFFYSINNERFIFGSELKVILSSEKINKEIDNLALDSFFTFGYVAGENTIFKEIKKLKPAHYLELNIKKKFVNIQRYWDVSFEPDYKTTEEEWSVQLEEQLSDSVKSHLVSDVPLGAFLSGGIDSSAVVAMMSKHSSSQVKTFSIGFHEEEFNELKFARQIAEKYNTEHHEQIVKPESIELLPKLARAYDEPFADSSAIPTYYVSKFAREYVTVVLSGDGGDELFAGYNSYQKLNAFYKYNLTPAVFNSLFWGNINKAIPVSVKGKGFTYYLSKDRRLVGAYIALMTQSERPFLYREHVWENIKRSSAEFYKERIINSCGTKDFISRMQELDIKTYMVDDILTKVDRASMQNSLEVRVPILDHKFAEFTFKIPSELKLKGKDKKYIFKKAMSKYLTDDVLFHKKQGFAVPLKYWFKNDLKDYLHERFTSNNNFINEHFDTSFMLKMISDAESGKRNLNGSIWALLFLDAWAQQYI